LIEEVKEEGARPTGIAAIRAQNQAAKAEREERRAAAALSTQDNSGELA